MRTVLHVISHLQKGGAERQLSLLTRRSAEDGHQEHVACLFDDGAETYHPAVTVHRLESFIPFAHLDRIVRQIKPDVGVLWLPERVTFPGLVAFRRHGVPCISMERCAPSHQRHLFVRDRVKYLSHLCADAMVSNFSVDPRRDPILSLIARLKRSEVIRNGYLFEAPPDLAQPSDVMQVVMVARLNKQKNLDAAIRLARALKSRKMAVRFDIIGEGLERAHLEALVKAMQVEDIVLFHGSLFPWRHLVDTESIFLSTSHNEGMPNVVFEAMSHGMVTITPELSETRDVLTHGQNTLSYRSEADLLALFENVLPNRPLRDTLREGGYALLRRFSVEKMYRHYASLFDELMA